MECGYCQRFTHAQSTILAVFDACFDVFIPVHLAGASLSGSFCRDLAHGPLKKLGEEKHGGLSANRYRAPTVRISPENSASHQEIKH
jgi:hypothetical protein